MLIPINDRFHITSDSRQWMIQRRRSRNGKEKWESRYYFGTLKAALKDLGELMVRESKTDTLVDCIRGRRNGHHHTVPRLNTPIRAAFRG